jgi:hypothetical protein
MASFLSSSNNAALSSPSSLVAIWSHEEAATRQVQQLTTSGCGVTAVVQCISYLLGTTLNETPQKEMSDCSTNSSDNSSPVSDDSNQLQFKVPSLDAIVSGSVLRLRKNDAPLPQYLASRAVAGCTGAELVESIANVCPTLISGEFVPSSLLPVDGRGQGSGNLGLIEWIAAQLKENKALVATFNLQLLGNDAWHHQFIYGVDFATRSIYCTNPVEAYAEPDFAAFISTPSVLLVRRSDILSRIDRPGGDISVYGQHDWLRLKVQQQIERMKSDSEMAYVVIPAAYIGMCWIVTLDLFVSGYIYIYIYIDILFISYYWLFLLYLINRWYFGI